jgi:arylsulfatase A-like enzyme
LLENPSFSDPNNLISKSIAQLQQSENPNFMTLFFSSAHFPYAAPWPWYSRYSHSQYSGPYYFKKDPDLSQSTSVSEEDIHQIRSLYAGSLSAIDTALGNLFEFLKANELWEQTMIVITADHGEDLFEFDRIQGHGEHLQGENVLKVPLLIKVPGSSVFNKNIHFTTRMIDLAPTLAGLVNTKLETAQGMDLSPWIHKELPNPNLTAYSETEIWFSRTGNAFFQKERIDYPNIASLLSLDIGGTGAIALNPSYENVLVTAKHRSLIQGRFKLIYTPTSNGVYFKLYDRILDPQNLSDIATKNLSVFNSMKNMMFKHVSQLETNTKLIENYVVPL